MKQKTILIIGVVLLLLLAFSPFLGAAAQLALTVDSLEKAYNARVLFLESEIASTTQAIAASYDARTCFSRLGCADYTSEEIIKLVQAKHALEFERRSLDSSYNLLKEALK